LNVDEVEFYEDSIVQDAVLRRLEIIGEAERTFQTISGLSIRMFHGGKSLV